MPFAFAHLVCVCVYVYVFAMCCVRYSILLNDSSEDAENDLLANCRFLADDKDPSFGDVFAETLASYEEQESQVKVLSHKVNGIIIAFLSAKNYMQAMRGSIDEDQSPIEVFFSDIRATFLSVKEEIGALEREEEDLDQFIRRNTPRSDVLSSSQDTLPSTQSVLKDLLDKYVLAEAHVKEAVRHDFNKLEAAFESKGKAKILQNKKNQHHSHHLKKYNSNNAFSSPIVSSSSSKDFLPKLGQSKRAGGGGGGGSSISSSFMRARNEAAKMTQVKGRKALLKGISDILPHVKYSTLERENENFQMQQQQRIRSKELTELHSRELKKLVRTCEEKLAKSTEEAKKKASEAAACLEWELHADVFTQHLKHCKKEKAIDDEIQAFITKEAEEKERIERERQEDAIRKEREHQKQLLSAYHDEVEKRRLAKEEERQMKKLQEEQERALLLVESGKRVKFRQQLDLMRTEERNAKEELIKEELRAKEMRLERLASSVAPEVEADPARLRSHTFASSSLFKEDQEGDGEAFNPVHGYFDDRLFQDQRFRIGEALRAAGLHSTQYGRQVLCDIKSNNPQRTDMKTSYQKMANR